MRIITLSSKYLLFIFTIFISIYSGFSQTKIAEITFESAGGYTTSLTECTDASGDYFTRTDGSDIAAIFTNLQGSYFFAAQDIDASGCPAATGANATFLMDDVNISGYTSLELRVHLAEDDDGANQDWDDTDLLHFDYDIDNSGTFSNLLWVESSGTTNTAPLIDTDFNGTGDGTEIIDAFAQFTQSITGTGSLLDIQIEFDLDSGDEDIAIDNIEIWGISSTPSPTITVTPSSLTGFTYVEGSGPSTEQSFDISGVNLTTDISVTTPTNWEFSTTSGGPYQTTPITLTHSGGTVNMTTIYTRMISGLLNTNSPFSGNMSCSSTGATSQNVAVNGNVTIAGSCTSIFTDDFSGTLSQWSNTSDWNITSGELKHNLSGVAAESYIYSDLGAQDLTTSDYEWEFCIRNGAWDPSGSNDFVFHLLSNDSDLQTNATGYAVGVNQTSTSDLLSLYSVNSGTFTEIIASTFDWNTNDDVCIKVTRNSSGLWELLYDANGVGEVSAGTITDTSFTTGQYIGGFFDFTSTRAGLLWLDDINICATAVCAPTHTITGFAPTSGPELTEVIITGTGFTSGSTISFNGVSAIIVFQTATEIVAEVPIGASTDNITVTESGCPLDSSSNFTFLDTSGPCSDTVSFTDVIITEVFDSNGGNGWYMELYNPTMSTIDLDAIGTDFEIERYATIGDASPSRTIDLTGTIAPNSVFSIRIGDATPNPCSSVTFDFTELGAGINEQDEIRLTKNGAQHDVVHCPNELGYSINRDSISTGPSTTYDALDWNLSSSEVCSDLGTFSLPPSFPTVSSISDITNCSVNSFSLTATAGNSGTLTYQWKYNDGIAAGWTDVLSTSFSPGVVIGETSDNITITGFNLEGYQFYCEVTEDSTCGIASNAAQVKITTTTWNGTVWSTGSAPTITDNAVIDGDYDTATFGSFSTCQLYVNSGAILTVDNSTYVEVENDATIYGELLVETQGAFVQNNNSGNFILDTGGTSSVNKSTTILNNWYDYTFWSSPIVDETVGTGLDIAPASRRFWFNASNYLDVFAETNNDNTLVAGHDDIDDDGNDWQIAPAASIMTPGVGYAATVSPTGFVVGTYQVNFEGEFNNGAITTSIAFNGANGDYDWNFIGNPYSGAIDTNAFFTTNSSVISGAAYLWSQNTPPSDTANGNEGQNFAQADYAIITSSGVNTAGGDGNIPNDYIPSGQGFFVQGLANGNVTFNNSMRMADISSNNQFFRTSNYEEKNVIWINLTSDNGVFNQIAISYIKEATNQNDGFGYDATRNLASGNAAILYSIIDGEDRMFAIQGRSLSSLNKEEIVDLGLKTNINIPTIYTLSVAQLEGQILTNSDVYLIDSLLQEEHNLSQSDYLFSSETGTFNNRFHIVFKISDVVLSDVLGPNQLVFVDNNSEDVILTTTHKSVISNIKIFDMLGRIIHNVDYTDDTRTVTISSSALRNSVFIIKATLDDGKVLTKKGLKN